MRLFVLSLVAASVASALAPAARADIINIAAAAGASQTTSVTVTNHLAAGTYSVGNIGITDGGLYDAWTIYAPSASNGAYTDG